MSEFSGAALPVLYSFRRCPYAMRARLAIVASGLRCELREVLLRDKPPEMLAASPKGTVPVLINVDGSVIEESLDIMHWALRRADPRRWLEPDRESLQDMLALVSRFDDGFKWHLDRYKYPNRYDHCDALAHRKAASVFLDELEARLRNSAFLFGSHLALADAAIAPFVRQFAHTDKAWFEAQPWPGVRTWLNAILDSEAFAVVMNKFPGWQPGNQALTFPAESLSDTAAA